MSAPAVMVWPDYKPNPGQALFHHYCQSGVRHVLALGGVGSGKTFSAGWQFLRNIVECGPNELHICAAPTNKLIRESCFATVVQQLRMFEDLNGWPLHRKIWNSDSDRSILFHNGSRAIFVTTSGEKFAGATCCGVWFDEAALSDNSLSAWKMLLERRRSTSAKFHYGFATTTPRGPVGIVDHMLSQAAQSDDFQVVKMPTILNAANLSPTYIQDLMIGCSRTEVLQQLYGEVLKFEAAIYGDEFCHVASIAKDWKFRQSDDCEYYLAVDHGPNNASCLFIEHHPSLDLDIVFDELHGNFDDMSNCRRAIKQAKINWGLDARDFCVYVDPNPITAVRVWRSKFPGRVYYTRRPAACNIVNGIQVVRGRLLDMNGDRRLLFAPRLRNTPSERRILQCMLLYKWREKAGGDAGGQYFLSQPTVNRPFVHAAAALRYYCLRYFGTRHVANNQ